MTVLDWIFAMYIVLILLFIGSCEDRPQKSCTFPGPGVKCWWNMQTNVCEVMNFNPAVKHHNYKVCPYLGKFHWFFQL